MDVIVQTVGREWWQVEDTAATPTYVTEQLNKVKWLPVIGPYHSDDRAAGFVSTQHVTAVRWRQAQP